MENFLKWLDTCGLADLHDVLTGFLEFDFKDTLAYFEACRLGSDEIEARFGQGSTLDALILAADVALFAPADLKSFLGKTAGAKPALQKEAVARIRQRAGIANSVSIGAAILERLAELEAEPGSPWFAPRLLAQTAQTFGWGAGPWKKLLPRLLNTLAHAAPRGGLRRHLEADGPNALGTRIGLLRAAASHPKDKPLPEMLVSALKKTSPAIRKEITKMLGPSQADVESAARSAQQLLTRLRDEASRGGGDAGLRAGFRELQALPPEVIQRLGRELRFAETRPKIILEHLWASIEKTWAQAMRR